MNFLISSNPLKAHRHAFYVFVESSTCVHKVMEYADDVSKLHDFSSYVLLGVYISLNF